MTDSRENALEAREDGIPRRDEQKLLAGNPGRGWKGDEGGLHQLRILISLSASGVTGLD